MAKKAPNKDGYIDVRSPYSSHLDAIAQDLALHGYTNAQIADALQISEDTFYTWRIKFPSFKDAVQKGKDTYDSEMVEKALLEDAVGKEYVEVTEVTDEDGRLVETKKKKNWQRNFQAQRMWLLNRHRDRWVDQTELVVSAKDLETKLQDAEKRLQELRAKYGKASETGDERRDIVETQGRPEGGEPLVPGSGDHQ